MQIFMEHPYVPGMCLNADLAPDIHGGRMV